MNIPTAGEARKKIEKGEYELAQKQREQVEKAINDAIEKGELRASIDGSLQVVIKTELGLKGYRVEVSSQYNECFTLISW